MTIQNPADYQIEVHFQGPEDVLDYTLDWDDRWLEGGDEIQSSEWDVETGITVEGGSKAPSNTTSTTTIWLSGGTVGQRYRVTNLIATSAGRLKERSFVVRIVRGL